MNSVIKASKESQIYSATAVGLIVRLELKMTLNVTNVERNIPEKIVSSDMLKLHTKSNFCIEMLFSPPSYLGIFFCKNICI